MRPTLLASAAVLASVAAQAQNSSVVPDPNPSQGQFIGKYGAGPAISNNNNAWGIANTPSGSKDAGQLSTIYAPNVNAVPTPGSVVVRLNGRVETDLTANFSNADNSVNSAGAATGYKSNPVGIGSFLRLYPGFDGVSANGLRYGAAAEIRQNFGAADRPFASTGATGGAANSPSSNSSTQTLYVRRAFTYIASDQAGLLRLGQADGVLGLFDNCIFSSSCFDGALGGLGGGQGFQGTAPAAVPITYVWLNGTANEFSNAKAVYLSPQFYGFDFGVQYAPNMGNTYQMTGLGVGCNQAGPTCISTTSGNDPTRWYNQTGAGVRYQQTFGGVDIKGYGFYETAGKANLTTASYVAPSPTASASLMRYDNMSFYKFGAAITAMNFTIAADYIGGAVNGQLAMRPQGGAPMSGVVSGVTYANGSISAGFQLGIANSQGAAQLTSISQRHEVGLVVGGSYRVAPGLQLVVDYQYAYRHQGGFNFASNSVGAGSTATAAGSTRDSQGQGVTFSTVLNW